MASQLRGTVFTTGVQDIWTPEDGPPCRREIHDLIKDDAQFSLYVRALSELQATAEYPHSYETWFQIGSIHGLPRDPWDNAPSKPEIPFPNGEKFIGYCAHKTQTFPTWHRPYVTLFEQTLQHHALDIASRYKTDQEKWQQAAQKLRAPYWDWAVYPVPPPELYSNLYLTITTEHGVDREFPNPLLSYTFTRILPKPYNRLDTFRENGMIKRLENYPNIEAKVHDMLTAKQSWLAFSQRRQVPGRIAPSIEEVHDGMHNRIGGKGFMGDPSVAAFDPIFWLHHANVDRLLSLWQAMHPQEWVGGSSLEADLLPFWANATEFHKSSSAAVRTWGLFGYNYPEFKGLATTSPEEVSLIIRKKVDEMYGPDVPKGGDRPGYTYWFIRVNTQAYAHGGSYSVFLFFGEPPSSPAGWRYADNIVGVDDVFDNPLPQSCPNCVENLDAINEGIINITQPLKQNDQYDQSVEETNVYLKQNLKWRIQRLDGTPIPDDQVPGLKITVETADITFDVPKGGSAPMVPNVGEPVVQIEF